MSDNEKRETHADIIAEMHRFAKQHEYDHPDMDTNARGIEDYADRLEAAHRREIAAGGDAAKLREALKRIVAASIVAKNANAPEWILQRMADIFAMATTALSEPPRNCDRFECKDIQSAMNVYRRECCVDCGPCYERRPGAMREAEWLLAPATEKEGGAK